MTTTSVTFPEDTIALNLAPTPTPFTVKSGGDEYSLPPLVTTTKDTFPPEIIGLSSTSFPFLMLTFGFLWKFKISVPYPVPCSYK